MNSPSDIELGNDELLVFLRKRFPNCPLTNDEIGSENWKFIRANDSNAVQTVKDLAVLWPINDAQRVNERALPKTATQFRFRRDLLPALYTFVELLGAKPATTK